MTIGSKVGLAIAAIAWANPQLAPQLCTPNQVSRAEQDGELLLVSLRLDSATD